jgi:hypothetical protein
MPCALCKQPLTTDRPPPPSLTRPCLPQLASGVPAATPPAEAVAAFLRAWLPSRLLERLFQMAAAIAKHVLPGAAAPEARFPALPGSHLPPDELGRPALAFVRTVCHVLALDASVEDEVRAACCAVLHYSVSQSVTSSLSTHRLKAKCALRAVLCYSASQSVTSSPSTHQSKAKCALRAVPRCKSAEHSTVSEVDCELLRVAGSAAPDTYATSVRVWEL